MLTDNGLHFADPASGLGTVYSEARWVDASGTALKLKLDELQVRFNKIESENRVFTSTNRSLNTELAVACTDQAQLTAAYRQLVKRYDVSHARAQISLPSSLKASARLLLDVVDGVAVVSKVAIKLGEYRKLEPGPIEEFVFFDHPSTRFRIHDAMRWRQAMGTP